MDKREITVKVVNALRDSHHIVHQIPIKAEHIKGYGDCRILAMIDRHYKMTGEGMKPSIIADILKVSAPTVSQKIWELEEKGFLVRRQSQQDRRATYLFLTPQGHQVVEKGFELLMNTCEAAVDHLGPEKAVLLCELLEEFKNGLIQNNQKGSD